MYGKQPANEQWNGVCDKSEWNGSWRMILFIRFKPQYAISLDYYARLCLSRGCLHLYCC